MIIQSLITYDQVFVFIGGASCSGKTTLCKRLKISTLVDSSVIKMDDYFLDIDDPKLPQFNERQSFNKIESYHFDELINHLNSLKESKIIYCPIYDIDSNKRTSKKRIVEPNPVILVDGLFAFNLANKLELNNKIKVFTDTTYLTRLKRRQLRDQKYASLDIIERHFENLIEPLYRKLILPQKKEADLIIEN